MPLPTRNLFDVSVAAPVPPLTTDNMPVIADASRVTADHDVLPAPSVFRKLFAEPMVAGRTNEFPGLPPTAQVICVVANTLVIVMPGVVMAPVNVGVPPSVVIPEKVAPDMDGPVLSTTLPDPVDKLTPVPPLATGSTPVTAVVRFMLVIVLPAPDPEMILFVSVSDVPVPTSVVVVFGRVSVLPPLTIVAIMGAVSVLLVSVSVVSLPTSLSVVVGRVSVPVLTIVAITGALSVGDIESTLLPDPVDRATPVPPRRTPKIPVVMAPVSIALVPAVIVLFVSVSAVPVPTSVVVASGNVMLRAAV